MSIRRHERVKELLIRAVGEVIRREMPVAEAGLITVSDVGLSNDLHSAVVFVSILGGEPQKKRGLDMLRRDSKKLQALVAQSVILKYAPRLRFEIDDSVERGNRVLHILEELEQAEKNQ